MKRQSTILKREIVKKGKIHNPLNAERKLNAHEVSKWRPGRSLNVLFKFNLRPVSRGKEFRKAFTVKLRCSKKDLQPCAKNIGKIAQVKKKL